MIGHRAGRSPLAEVRLGPVPAILVLLLTVGLVLAWRFVPLKAALLVAIYVACVGIVIGWSVIEALASAYADQWSEFDAVTAPVEEAMSSRPHELVEIEQIVADARRSASSVHVSLRPLVRAIVAPPLNDESEGRDDDTASTLGPTDVGAATWDLVRPDRPRPVVRDAPGFDLASLGAIIDELEVYRSDA